MPCCREGNSGSPVNLEILGHAHLLVLKPTRFLVVLLAQHFFFSVRVSRFIYVSFTQFLSINYLEEHLSTLSLERFTRRYSENDIS